MLHSHTAFAARCALIVAAMSATEIGSGQEPSLPTVKFFYYDSARVEWVVTAEPDRLQPHLEANQDSESLFQSTLTAVINLEESEEVQSQMARWIEQERQRFRQTSTGTARFRKAEGIVAYLRAHDFSVSNLIDALTKRSGASTVELAAIHLVDGSGQSSYKLKVLLVDATIEIGKQGFNVDIRSPQVTYLSVVYALGVALYEVHEIINADVPSDAEEPLQEIELLPLPEPPITSPRIIR